MVHERSDTAGQARGNGCFQLARTLAGMHRIEGVEAAEHAGIAEDKRR